MRTRLVTGGANSRASAEFDAATGTLLAGSTFTRASTATRLDYRGYTVENAADSPRFTYNPTLIYNEAINPWGDGGSPPTEWSTIAAGLSYTVTNRIPNGDGTVTVEITISGTSNGNDTTIYTTSSAGLPIDHQTVPGDIWAFEMGIEVVSITGATARCWLASLNASGSTINSNSFPSAPILAGAPAARYRLQGALINSGTAGAGGGLRIADVVNGVAVNAVIRLTFPVFGRGSAHLTDTVPLGTLAARNGTTPQHGLLGLLKEESATNAVANPRLEGAVAGSPGTPPPLGFISGSGDGLTRTMAIGFEDGQQFADFRWSGTASASNQIIIGLSAGAALPCVAGETCSGAVNISVFGPNLPPTSVLRITENGASVFTATDVSVPGTTQPQRLRSNRVPVTRTFTDASTTDAGYLYVATYTNGQTYDFTIRIQLPQLEKQPFPTSVALPPVGVPGAAIRARDSLQLPTSTLNFPAGAIAVRFQLARWGSSGVGGGNNFLFGNGESAERVSCNMANDVPTLTIQQGGAPVMSRIRPGGTAPRDTWINGAITWGGGSGLISWDAEVPVLDASCPSPAPAAPLFYVGANWANAANQSSPIIFRYIRIWRDKKLSAAQVRRESARTS